MLNNEQITLIQSSFLQVVPRADPMARMFYAKLFELRPDFRPMFSEDMTDQRGKLVSTLATVVQGLGDLEALAPAVADLGRRHVGYNVKSQDYGPVGEALLWTLGEVLGDAWREETKDAWAAAYALLSKVMIDAARDVDAA